MSDNIANISESVNNIKLYFRVFIFKELNQGRKNFLFSVLLTNYKCYLAKSFGQDWIIENYLPKVIQYSKMDKKGYNYRMACLNSMSAVMPYLSQDHVNNTIVPLLLKGMSDTIPNVKFCVSKIII